MAKVMHHAGRSTSSIVLGYLTSRYVYILGFLSTDSTETNCPLMIYSEGVISNLSVWVGSNSCITSTPFQLRKNGSNANSLVTIPAGVTGWLTDIVNTDTTSGSGDRINAYTINNSSTGSCSIAGCTYDFESTVNTTSLRKTAGPAFSYTCSSAIEYFMVGKSTTLANNEIKHPSVGIAKYLGCYVYSNTSNISCIFRSIKNGVTGNMVIVIPSTSTGSFYDTSNSDSISSDDNFCFVTDNSDGTGSIVFKSVGYEFETKDGNGFLATSGANVTITSAGRYFHPQVISDTNSENYYHIVSAHRNEVRGIGIYLSINNATADGSYILRKNGSNTSVSVTVTLGTTGWFSDLSHTATYEIGDWLSLVWNRGNFTSIVQSIFLIERSLEGGKLSGISSLSNAASITI